MTFELFASEAPVTAANFLRYVDERRYANAVFYRTVTAENQAAEQTPVSVIQGGLDRKDSAALPPIPHESTDVTGVKHLHGTLSMARLAVGTASSEFFICVGNQPALDFGGTRQPDGLGFAAFGRLREGGEVVSAIHERTEVGQRLTEPVRILGVKRLAARAS